MSEPTDPEDPQVPEEFALKDCALVAIATGRKALTIQEFREHLLGVDLASIYHHFWGGLLHARFEEREYNNDFASWVRHGLHDTVLGERLAMLDPTDFADLEDLRLEIVELIDQRLDESEALHWMRASRQFEFTRSQIVVFDTGRRIRQAEHLAALAPDMSASSVFYHFIDARRRLPQRVSDFSFWLSGFDGIYADLCEQLDGIDPYFGSLQELRDRLGEIFGTHFAEAAS